MNNETPAVWDALPPQQVKPVPVSRHALASFLFRKQRPGEDCTEEALQVDSPLMEEFVRLRLTVGEALRLPHDDERLALLRELALGTFVPPSLKPREPAEQGCPDCKG